MSRDQPRRVDPAPPKGTQDFLPARALARLGLISSVRSAYESHGFAPLDTSVLETRDALLGSGGDETNASIFSASCGDEEPLGLRFDLTVPLARVVAAHQQDLPRPFRRYQVGSVFRADKPGPGRYRDFVQFDADIVGANGPVADAIVVAALRDAFDRIAPPAGGGEPRFRIRLSDRRILDALVRHADLPADRTPDILRVVDKLDRIGREKVRLELTEGYRDDSGDRIAGVGLAASGVSILLDFLAIEGARRDGVVGDLRSFFASSPDATPAIDAVAELSQLIGAMGVTDAHARLDVSIARGLAYYTGPVFEVALLEAPMVGSVGSGGRYDNLVSRFSGQPWPGVGVSVGIDRVLAALELAGTLPPSRPTADVLVTTMDAMRMTEYAALCDELRAAGLRVELHAGPPGGLGRQLKHADRSGIPVAVIAGSDEFARGVVTIKQMLEPTFESEVSRQEWLAARLGQREVARDEVASAVRACVTSSAKTA